MSAKDKYHNAVKNALIRDGWLLLESDFRYVLRELEVRLIFFDITAEEVTEWIETPTIVP